MTIYIILVAIATCIVIATVNSGYYNRVLTVVFFIIITTISAMRGSIGGDTEHYKQIYSIMLRSDLSEALRYNYEKGFLFLVFLFSRIFKNINGITVFSSLVINLLVLRSILRGSRNPALSALLYILTTFYFSYMNLMRFGIASAIIMNAFQDLKDGHALRFALEVIVASLFHISAIICLSLLCARIYPKEGKSRIIIFSSVCVVVVLLLRFSEHFIGIGLMLFPSYGAYLDSIFIKGHKIGNVAIACFYYLLYVLVMRSPSAALDKYDYLSMILGEVFLLLAIASTILGRFANYFVINIILYLPNNLPSKIKYDRLICRVLLVYLLFFYFIIISFMRPEWFLVSPYRMWLFE